MADHMTAAATTVVRRPHMAPIGEVHERRDERHSDHRAAALLEARLEGNGRALCARHADVGSERDRSGDAILWTPSARISLDGGETPRPDPGAK